MLITNLKLTKEDQRARASALVKWEDADRPEKEIFIETEEKFASDFMCNPHSFLLGCVPPAMHLGEKRLKLEAKIDPGLMEGLQTIMALFSLWSDGAYRPLTIEAPTSAEVPRHDRPRRAGLFLSGGIDSLAALRLNRLTYPKSHPGAVQDCLLLHGFDIGGVQARGMKYHVFARALEAMAPVAADAGVEMIPVYTNIRHLCDQRELWLHYFFGSVLAAAGHALTPRLNLLYIAASYDLPNLVPCASHPLLDPNFSSFDLPVRHTGRRICPVWTS